MLHNSDYIQFEDGERGTLIARNVISRAPGLAQQIGDFPPPEEIWLCWPVEAPDVLAVSVDPEVLADFWGDTGVEVVVTPFERISYSKITDEQIKDMTNVARGAIYHPAAT